MSKPQMWGNRNIEEEARADRQTRGRRASSSASRRTTSSSSSRRASSHNSRSASSRSASSRSTSARGSRNSYSSRNSYRSRDEYSQRDNAFDNPLITGNDGARQARSTRSTTSHRANPSRSSHTNGTHRSNRGHRLQPGDPGYKKKSRVGLFFKILGIVIAVCAGLGIAAFAYLYATTDVPEPESFALAQKTTVYYADGKTPIGNLSAQNRTIIACDTLPKYVGNAVVASENQTFWSDSGIDLKGIARALVNNVTKGTRQGGSTITQQYAERYYLGQTDTYLGKLHEAILALKITQSQSKSQILCNYLNTIYLGRGTYGIEAAARSYFNKPAKDLTIEESALIAGIIPSPGYWAPDVNPQIAQKRYNRTIELMYKNKFITAAELEHAKKNFPQVTDHQVSNDYEGTKGYLLQQVKNELVQRKAFSEDEISTGGYSIVTTIDQKAQEALVKVGQTRFAGEPDSYKQTAISANPKTGAIIAIYGGDDFLKHQYNNATQAVFQPGSTMKPFTLLTGIQKGVSLKTVYNGNSFRHFDGLNGTVSNAEQINWGNINLWQALANSVNTPFVQLDQEVTPQAAAANMKKAGFPSVDENNPLNTLGINATTALQMARAHSTLAAGGIRPDVHIVASVRTSSNEELYHARTEGTRVFSRHDSLLVLRAMQNVTRLAAGAEPAALLRSGREIASKTGTANDMTAFSYVASMPSNTTVFAVWNEDDKGNPVALPVMLGGYAYSNYPAHLYAQFANAYLTGLPVEKWENVKDTGKVGGPSGTWGLGNGQASDALATASYDAPVVKKKDSSQGAPAPQDSQNGENQTQEPDQSDSGQSSDSSQENKPDGQGSSSGSHDTTTPDSQGNDSNTPEKNPSTDTSQPTTPGDGTGAGADSAESTEN